MGKENTFEIDLANIPKHVAIIMDGNGRWAKKRGLPKKAGHRAGADTLERIVEYAERLGVKFITVYAFSTENWKRSPDEIASIMDLLRRYLKEHIKTSEKRNVRVKIIGERTRLDEDIQEQISTLEKITKYKKGITLNIALNYGGRDELIRSIKDMFEDVKIGNIKEDQINEEVFSHYLDTKDIPDPELLIRTSGEERISNFLLWQIAYSEFNFSHVLWPDYSEMDFKQAIWEYQNRDRRFGGRNS